jgi:hypothetical protein
MRGKKRKRCPAKTSRASPRLAGRKSEQLSGVHKSTKNIPVLQEQTKKPPRSVHPAPKCIPPSSQFISSSIFSAKFSLLTIYQNKKGERKITATESANNFSSPKQESSRRQERRSWPWDCAQTRGS